MPHLVQLLSSNSVKRRFRCAFALFLFSLVAGAVAHAQVGANLSGAVKDSTGAGIPDATITIANEATGESQRLKAGEHGEFRAVNLEPGKYTITATAQGFGTTKKSVELIVGSELTTDVDLGAAGTSDVVNVEAGGADSLIETTVSQPSAVIDNRQLSELPVLNRSFLAIAQTMPGVASIAAMSITTKFAISKFGGVADQRNGYTTIIDGSPLDDSTWGTPVINISQDAIQEFKVYSHQFDAQYGKALNAVVNVVTLAGGDKYHGTGYYFGRNADLNAQNAMATIKPPYSLLRVGSTVGGPIPKLRNTHAFGSYEYLRINTAFIEALPATNPFAAEENGNYPYTQWESIADVKLDHTFNDRHHAYSRYAYDHQYLPNGGPANSANTTTDNSIAHSLVFEDDYSLTPKILNSARYEFLTHNLFSTPANLNTELVYPDFSFGQNSTLPQYFPRTNHTVSDTMFFSEGKHDLKIGAELVKVFSTYNSHYYEHGQFNFTSDTAFDPTSASPNYPQSFVQQSNGQYYTREFWYTGFVQDNYKVRPNLTLNLGFRYDFTSNMRNDAFYTGLLSNSFFTGVNNFVNANRGTDFVGGMQPRFGVAYDVDGKGKLVIRAGFGMYQTRMRPYWALQDQTQTLGAAVRITNPTQLAQYPSISGVLNGETLQQYVNSGGARAANILDNHFSLPYSENFTGGIAWQVDNKSSLTVTFDHDKTMREIGTHDLNLPAAPYVLTPQAGTTVAAANEAPRPVSRFTTFGDVFNDGSSRYDALELQYRTRPKYLDTLVVSYAYSRSLINSVTYYSTYVGTQRTPSNYSYNPTDTPNNLSISAASRPFFHDFRLSTIFSGLSGSPYATSAGIDLDGDGSTTNDRPYGLPQFVGRGDVQGQLNLINAFRANPCGFFYYTYLTCTIKPYSTTPITKSQLVPDATLTWSARLTKQFHFGERKVLEGFFEGFNLANHPTRYAPGTTMNTSSYMIPTAALDARDMQWGARFTY